MKDTKALIARLTARPGKRVKLKHHDPEWTGSWRNESKARTALAKGIEDLAKLQTMLYAQDTYSVLMIFQAMDAAGKDGTIRHVMSGVNPQGCEVYSFKVPSAEERDHTYLWRSMKAVPERGRIGIHNRSYYEEVLVARVHREILAGQQLPPDLKGAGIWKRRFDEINCFEKHLTNNGTVVLKFFLNVSRAEQKRRFLDRIDDEEKNWKFSVGDAKERARWGEYMDAYEDMLSHTSTTHAPWFIIPADRKWFTHLAVAAIVRRALMDLKLSFPTVTPEKKRELLEVRRVLMAEDD